MRKVTTVMKSIQMKILAFEFQKLNKNEKRIGLKL